MIRMGSSLITTVQPVLVTNTSDKKRVFYLVIKGKVTS